MQLRCVCKSWNSLISDPNFANKHLCWSRTQLNRHHLLVSCSDFRSAVDFSIWDTQLTSFFNSASTGICGTWLRYPFNIQDESHDDKLIGSCNGIVCFSIDYLVSPTSFNRWLLFVAMIWINLIGFVKFKSSFILCLGKDTWKTVEGFPSRLGEGILSIESGRFVSGTINWLVWEPTDSSSSSAIVSLNLGNESYQEFSPPDYGEVVHDLTLGVLRDCLCIFSHTDTLLIHVWTMKDYGNKDSWTKLFSVPYMELLGNIDPASAYPLYISEDDQLLLDFEMEESDGTGMAHEVPAKLAVYNSRDGTGKTHEVQSILGSNFDWVDNIVYIESLISP